MATRTKKPAAKRAKTSKSAAAKATSKKTTKKSPAKVAATQARAVSKFDLVRRFHLFAGGLSAIIAVAAAFLLDNTSFNLTSTYADKDAIASGAQTVLGTAYQTVVTVEFRYLVVAVFALSAILSLLLATSLRARYEAGVKNATSGIRWIFTGAIVGLIIELITILAGVQDIATLKLVAGLVITTTVLRWLSERDNKNTAPHWGTFALSVFTGTLAWLPAVFAIVGTHLYGMERYGWHVYALAVLVGAGAINFAVSHYQFIKYPSIRKDYLRAEEKYLSNELFIKLSFAAVVFIALID